MILVAFWCCAKHLLRCSHIRRQHVFKARSSRQISEQRYLNPFLLTPATQIRSKPSSCRRSIETVKISLANPMNSLKLTAIKICCITLTHDPPTHPNVIVGLDEWTVTPIPLHLQGAAKFLDAPYNTRKSRSEACMHMNV